MNKQSPHKFKSILLWIVHYYVKNIKSLGKGEVFFIRVANLFLNPQKFHLKSQICRTPLTGGVAKRSAKIRNNMYYKLLVNPVFWFGQKVCQIISVIKINTCSFVVFKSKYELKCQNELFSGNTECFLFITEIIWRTFDVIIDNP